MLIVPKVSKSQQMFPTFISVNVPVQRNISSTPAARLGVHTLEQRPGQFGEVA